MTATSASNAWAVGTYEALGWQQALIEHWDGTAWTIVPSPDPGGPGANNFLYAVAATSPSNAWAVGSYRKSGAWHTLIEHWNGTAWAVTPSPSPGGVSTNAHIPSNALYSISAVSPTDIWAVGKYQRRNDMQTLTLHWNGRIWTRVPSPNVGGTKKFNELLGVAATAPWNAWAVGAALHPRTGRTLLMHWNGRSWRIVRGPSPMDPTLVGVTASSAHNAWAVGIWGELGANALALHWNGRTWQRVAAPLSRGNGALDGASTNSIRSAWAVAWNGYQHPWRILHWNGTAWQVDKAATGPADGNLNGVDVAANADAWAVGNYGSTGSSLTLIEHWNGKSWQQVTSPSE
ncbi:MAG: hypothetical protein ACYCVZ_14480 [Streptosporangiaceae bacterium]